MHWYKFHIGDYRSDTSHLSNEEDLAYRRILDIYYDTEKPIPANMEWIVRRIKINSTSVEPVLNDFFTLVDGFYYHNRCDEEIELYNEFLLKQSNSGKASALSRKQRKEKRLNQRSTSVQPEGNQIQPNQEPVTTNHQPIKRDSYESLPANFQLSEYRDESIRFSVWWAEELKPGTIKDNPTNRAKWAHVWFHLRETDGRANGAEMSEAIMWARSEPFWSTNFMSPMKLREKDKSGIAYMDRFLEQYRKQKDGGKLNGGIQRGVTAAKLGRLADHINSGETVFAGVG